MTGLDLSKICHHDQAANVCIMIKRDMHVHVEITRITANRDQRGNFFKNNKLNKNAIRD